MIATRLSAHSVGTSSGLLLADGTRLAVLILSSNDVFFIDTGPVATVASSIPITSDLLITGDQARRPLQAIANSAIIVGILEYFRV